MYSAQTSSILVCMVITGVCRSIAVKLFYQLGYDNSLFVAVLYLLGQSSSLFVYFISKYYNRRRHYTNERMELVLSNGVGNRNGNGITMPIYGSASTALPSNTDKGICINKGTNTNLMISDDQVNENSEWKDCLPNGNSSHQLSNDKTNERCDGGDVENTACIPQALVSDGIHLVPKSNVTTCTGVGLIRRGSSHGLTEESIEAMSIVHRIPWYIKPAISGFFNFCNSALRWASYIYVPASKAEMLIAGTELILSVGASRIIRMRFVSRTRWIAVGIVTFGILIIGFSHLSGDDNTPNINYNATNQDDMYDDMTFISSQSSTKSSHHTTGNILIFGQSLMSVLQDIADEIFLQESNFPATLLLGMEGIYGLLFSILICMVTVPLLKGNTIINIFMDGRQVTTFLVMYSVGLTMWFTLTGIFNIWATEATSSMTRNVWKNARTLLVWLIGLIIYYCYNDQSYNGVNDDNDYPGSIIGEVWSAPESYIILLGYAIMLVGLYVYYQ